MRSTPLVLLLLALIGLSACTVQTDLIFDAEGRGRSTVRVTMSPLLRRYLGDLAELQGLETDAATSFFDTAALTRGFADAPGLDLIGILNSEPDTLDLILTFPEIEELFPPELSPDGELVVRRYKEGSAEVLEFTIDSSNVAAVMGVVPLGQDPVSQTVSGIFQSGGSEEELNEMLVWVFEEYAPPEEIQEMIDSAAIELAVTVPGTLIDVGGGRIDAKNRAVFEIPLTRFLSLDPPLSLKMRYTP